MKRNFNLLVIAIYFFSTCIGFAQIPESFKKRSSLVPYRKGDKWGFSDRTKKIVIKPVYEETAPFDGDEALVTIDAASLFIDRTGKRVNLSVEDEIMEEVGEHIVYEGTRNEYSGSYNLLQDPKTRKWCINNFKKGKPVTAYEFDGDAGFGKSRNGYFLPSKNFKFGVVDSLGRIVVPLEFDYMEFADFYDAAHNPCFIVGKGPAINVLKFGLMDVNGKTLLPTEYGRIKAYYPADDLFIVLLNGKFGIVNSKKETILPFLYESVSYEDGLFRADKNDMWGIIDRTQKIIIPFEYKEINPFVNGVAIADKGGKKGMINKRNEAIIPFEYTYLSKLNNGPSYIAGKNEKYGVVDTSGKTVLPIELTNMEALDFFYEYGVYLIYKNDLVGLFEAPGHVICQPKYKTIEGVVNTDLFKVTTLSDEIGYIDSTGKEYFEK